MTDHMTEFFLILCAIWNMYMLDDKKIKQIKIPILDIMYDNSMSKLI